MKPSAGDRREKIYIYGKHALMEALTNAPRAIRKVFLLPEMNNDTELRDLITKRNIKLEVMKRNDADRMVGEDASHQGVIAIADPAAIVMDFHYFMREFGGGTPDRHSSPRTMIGRESMFVLLDELTDPHNVGAIIRSAAAFGATAVLMPSHNQAPITGAVVKASAGMVFRVPLVSLGNVNQAVDFLKKEFDFKIYGLAMEGSKNVGDEPFDAPALIIVGNEGRGIRQKTLERCDVTLRIPMDPRCESLNALVSAAVVLYEWAKKQGTGE